MSTITERLLERHRVDSERMWPAPSDHDLLAAERIKELEEALGEFTTSYEIRDSRYMIAAHKRALAALYPKEPK